MTSMEIVILGAPGDRRNHICTTIRSIGHEPVFAESEPNVTGDILLVDLDDAPDAHALNAVEFDERPLLVLAGEIYPELRRLMARQADTMLVTDPSECGVRTALATVSALVQQSSARPGRAVAWMAAAS